MGNRKQRFKFLIYLLLVSPSILHAGSGKVPIYRRNGAFGHKVYQKAPYNPFGRQVPPMNKGALILNEVTLPQTLHQRISMDGKNMIKKEIIRSRFQLQHKSIPTPVQNAKYIMKKCKGRKNILDDIGILSLITAVTASTFGLYTVMFNSMPSNNLGIISGILSIVLWLPSTLLTSWNLPENWATHIGNYINGLSFINSMYGFMGVILGTADVFASTIGEIVGILSLILSVVATFPDWLDSIIEYLYRVGDRRRLEYYVENYGCQVPSIFHLDWRGSTLYDRINNFLVEQTVKNGNEF